MSACPARIIAKYRGAGHYLYGERTNSIRQIHRFRATHLAAGSHAR